VPLNPTPCRWQLFLCIALMGCAPPSQTGAAELAPEQVIATTAAAVADSVTQRRRQLKADPAELHAIADRLLRPQFDLESACRLILREHWKTATPAQRERFVAAFYHFLLASYAHALLDFRYDTLALLPAEGPPGDAAFKVKTIMKLRDGSTYHVDFYMRPTPGGWKIVDVIAEGVSYVRTYRTDFAAEIRADGLEGLVARLERTQSKMPARGQ